MAKQIQVLPQANHIWVPRGQVVTPPPVEDRFAAFRSHSGPKITLPGPASASGIGYEPVAGGWSKDPGVTHTVHVYAYIVIGGTTYYSATYATASVVIPVGPPDVAAFTWTWDAVTWAHGYKLLRFTDDANYPMAYDFYSQPSFVLPDSRATTFPDTGPEVWFAGSTVTPNEISSAFFNASALSSWTDLTGNGHHLLQATAAKQPILVLNQLNGFPAVRFDGVDDFMQCAAFPAITNNLTFVALLKQNSLATFRRLVSGTSPTANGPSLITDNTFGVGRWSVQRGSLLISDVVSNTTPTIFSLIFTQAACTLRINGVSYTGNMAAGSPLVDLVLGANILTGGTVVSYTGLDVFGLDVWASARTLAQVIAAEDAMYADYIRTKSADSDGVRVTTAGDTRVTTAGDIRILG